MRRLYLQIYVTFLGILLLFGVLVSMAWAPAPNALPRSVVCCWTAWGPLLGEFLPGPERPVAELQAAVERLGQLFPAHFTVRAG